MYPASVINPELDLELAFEPAGNEREECEWVVPAGLSLLVGHFPGMPVLPAVAMLEACVQLARKAAREPALELVEIRAAKFLQPLSPGDRVRIACRRPAPGFDAWQFSWTRGGESVADIRMRLERQRLD